MKNFFLIATAAYVATCSIAHAASTYSLTILDDYPDSMLGYPVPGGFNKQGVVVGQSSSPFGLAIKWINGQAIALSSIGNHSAALSVNAAGQIVGKFSDTVDGVDLPVVWNTDGTTTRLKPLDPTASTAATGINKKGLIVGYSHRIDPNNSADDRSHAVLWKNGKVIDLAMLPSGFQSTAAAISDSGVIVGNCSMSDGFSHATRWIDAQPEDLGALGENASSSATSVNASGQIAGWSQGANRTGMYAVTWLDGSLISLGALDDDDAEALAINSKGAIVGHAVTKTWEDRAMLWQGGKIIDLNTKISDKKRQHGWVLKSAVGIDDSGKIIGLAYDGWTGSWHTYLLTPQ
ncbi:DUF3466 family protein [Ideonella azotifigens]|uniref:HAF repeat-containing protein n=1 Tax=Ideonella azotifigens TaxID=513160 RepID=A0ABP3VUL2_9BURK|nr:DUF3466 family protein [Ideonella azotifigens]MCD2339426.1 DUF3466 family protein [Ideonella azotifigens]